MGICIVAYKARIGNFKQKFNQKKMNMVELNSSSVKLNTHILIRMLIWSVLLISVCSQLECYAGNKKEILVGGKTS